MPGILPFDIFGRGRGIPGAHGQTKKMAGPTGFEPATSRLTIWRPKPG